MQIYALLVKDSVDCCPAHEAIQRGLHEHAHARLGAHNVQARDFLWLRKHVARSCAARTCEWRAHVVVQPRPGMALHSIIC